MAEGESKSSSCLKVLGIGCVVVVVVLIIAVVGGGYYVKTQWHHLAASAVTAVTDGILADSRLSESDKAGVKSEIERFTTQLDAGNVSGEQIKRLADVLQQGSLPGLLFLHGISTRQLVPPGVPEEELAQASLNAQRLQRAAVEGKITPQALMAVFQAIPKDPQTNRAEKEIKVEDWRPVMAMVKKMADDAGIPNEPYQLDLTLEIRKLLEQVLATSK